MTKGRDITNLPASVHDRLLTLARAQGIQYQEALQYFAMERFLYRLSRSTHARSFVLKGALMLRVWQIPQSRLTRDIDLLGFTDNSTDNLAAVVRDVCLTPVLDDGLTFEVETVNAQPIRERADYEGVRVTFVAHLGKSVLPMQIDIGFADAITPAPEVIDYPVLLDFPAPRLRAYPRETTVAEKFQAMVELGENNSRMKDFYDLWQMSRLFEFDGKVLCAAIRATFHRRGTTFGNETPVALTDAFGANGSKLTQWRAFLRKSRLQDAEGGWAEVIASLREWLLPIVTALQQNAQLERKWQPTRGWRSLT